MSNKQLRYAIEIVWLLFGPLNENNNLKSREKVILKWM